jgi:lipid A 3-O-deacylase
MLCASGVQADDASQPVPPDAGPQTLSVLFENDLFGETDQQYTNGFKLNWMSPNLKALGDAPGVPSWLLRAVHGLNAFEHAVLGENDRAFNLGFTVGQLMFTPGDTQAVQLVDDDRPYAGWLFGGLTLVSKTDYVADTFDIQVGMIGPASLAEDAQRLVHELRGFDVPRGWQNQLSNEPAFLLYYERKWRLLRGPLVSQFGYDLITHAGLAAGTVMDYGAAGAELRVGWNLPHDFGTSLIRPGGDANAPSTVTGAGGQGRGFGAYGFAALGGRLVGRNIFLDGNTFEDSHSVDKKIPVGDLIIGASMIYDGIKLSYAQVFRTKEFDGQHRRHNFGSISLSLSF